MARLQSEDFIIRRGEKCVVLVEINFVCHIDWRVFRIFQYMPTYIFCKSIIGLCRKKAQT